jgi:hypothetical protein
VKPGECAVGVFVVKNARLKPGISQKHEDEGREAQEKQSCDGIFQHGNGIFQKFVLPARR